jgi:regulator of protease activity HflC (stomatin/prohibitin superfamily)
MAHKLHKALCDRESEILAPIRMVDVKLRSAIGTYNDERTRAREAQERAEAERRRKEDEARAAQEAAQLEAAGEHMMAAQVLEEAIAAPTPVVVLPDEMKAIEGLSLRTEYRWRYLDNDPVRAFQLIPREYLVVDEVKLTRLAKAMKGTAHVPGITFYTEKVPVR